ncbi:MAG TPA: HlyD family efflux transporter periplasmic adaptor subunit [Dissulfurispiraceae bacterium]|nr:HlyD family efflux transporter periplasmic adaptor subunit [Dissulfurispiraceae bacterium]
MKALIISLTAVVLFLAGCADRHPSSWQGYAEGEFVFVATSEAGRLDKLFVNRGQQITSGMPLFALESMNEAAAVRKAKQDLNAATASLNDLKTGKRPQEIDVIREQHEQARAASKKSADNLARSETLFKSGYIARAQLDEARAEADANAARVRELSDQIRVATLPGRIEQIKAQSAAVASAQALLDQAEWRLNQKAIVATRTGLVFDTLYREGEWVPTGSPVVRMLPPENIKIRFFVPQTMVGALSIGQEIIVHCDGCPSDVPAKVTYISTEPEYTPPIIYSNETRSKLVFMIEAYPAPEKAATLHPGQPVEVRLK